MQLAKSQSSFTSRRMDVSSAGLFETYEEAAAILICTLSSSDMMVLMSLNSEIFVPYRSVAPSFLFKRKSKEKTQRRLQLTETEEENVASYRGGTSTSNTVARVAKNPSMVKIRSESIKRSAESSCYFSSLAWDYNALCFFDHWEGGGSNLISLSKAVTYPSGVNGGET